MKKQKSRFNNKSMIVFLLVALYQLVQVLASDGCSISGKDGVCCENSGVGPLCAKCTSQCQPNTDKGSQACSISDSSCGSTQDCTSQLSTRTITDKSFTGKGSLTDTALTASNFYTNGASNECPIFNCELLVNEQTLTASVSFGKYGVKFASSDADAVIQHDDSSCTECAPGYTGKSAYVRCYTYYDAAATDPTTT